MKVLVMGGTRFNGLALVQELAKWGHEVTVLNRGQSKAPLPRAVRRHADRTNHDQLREVLGAEEFDVVQDTSGYALADVQPLVEILRGRIGHYVFASSTVIYAKARVLPIRESDLVDRSERQTEYGSQKLKVEAYLFEQYRTNGFPATVVPFSMVFGPNNIIADREQRMFQRLLLGRPVLIPGDGTTLSQIGHVDDGAVAMRLLMMQPQTFGKRYNLTGRDYWSDEVYVDTFGELLGVTPRKVFVPAQVMDEIYTGQGEQSATRQGLPRMQASPATLRRPPSPGRTRGRWTSAGSSSGSRLTSTTGTTAPSSRSSGCGRTSGSGPRTPSRPRWSRPMTGSGARNSTNLCNSTSAGRTTSSSGWVRSKSPGRLGLARFPVPPRSSALTGSRHRDTRHASSGCGLAGRRSGGTVMLS